MKNATLTLLSFCLLLAACGGSAPAPGEERKGPARGVPDDVPLYSEDSDAKKTDYAVTDTDILVTMETINGPISPITYYRNRLPAAGWEITQDAEDDRGTILAIKRSRETEVTFTPLPGGAGAEILLRTTRES